MKTFEQEKIDRANQKYQTYMKNSKEELEAFVEIYEKKIKREREVSFKIFVLKKTGINIEKIFFGIQKKLSMAIVLLPVLFFIGIVLNQIFKIIDIQKNPSWLIIGFVVCMGPMMIFALFAEMVKITENEKELRIIKDVLLSKFTNKKLSQQDFGNGNIPYGG